MQLAQAGPDGLEGQLDQGKVVSPRIDSVGHNDVKMVTISHMKRGTVVQDDRSMPDLNLLVVP